MHNDAKEKLTASESFETPTRTDRDICASCIHDEPNYVSVIGTIPHCCKRHWACKPGGPATEYEPKTSDIESKEETT